MTHFYYFAYGSNMLTERLRARCPSAVRVGIAETANFALEFSKRSRDSSGKATLVAADGDNSRSLGIVFEISENELGALDKAEGAGSGYDVDDGFAVRLSTDGGIIFTRTYLSTTSHPYLRPYDWYLALVIAGAREHGLDSRYVDRLCEVAYDVDPEKDRRTRGDALAALARAEFPDYRALLPPEPSPTFAGVSPRGPRSSRSSG